jgi:hypothetical protein
MQIFIIVLLFLPVVAVAQQKDLTDSTEFRFGLPVSNDDTTQRVRSDQDPANQWIAVDNSALPKKLKRTLDRNEIYEGWEKSELYFDKRINRYLLRMRDGNVVRTYGLAPDGSPVSFTEEEILTPDSVN